MIYALVFLYACRSESGVHEMSSVGDTGDLQGRVWTVSGDPVPGAMVTAGGASTVTDDGGYFYLEGLAVGDVVVEASAEGYSTAGGLRTVVPGGWTYADLRVQPSVVYSWDPTGDPTLRTDEGVEIVFPDEGVLYTDGTVARSVIEVAVSALFTQDELTAAPGALMARDEGTERLLESAGMVEVRLFDGDGEPLQLAAPATLSFPVADVYSAAREPETYTLFGYDPETGRWEAASGGEVADGRFTAEVSHFSWWNCDRFANTDQCVTGTLVTGDGEPLADVSLTVTETLSLTTGRFETDSDGTFLISLPRGELVSLQLEYGRYRWSSGDEPEYADGVLLPDTVALDRPGDCVQLGTLLAANTDADVDGYIEAGHGGSDCDDADAAIHPGAEESWYDGVDQDCDGASDDDQDQDGHDAERAGGSDCDDTDASVNPDQREYCEPAGEAQTDDNCSGDAEADAVDAWSWYVDADGDGYGVEPVIVVTCQALPSGYAAHAGDCDDADPVIHPGPRGQGEDCESPTVDYNCDTILPDSVDADGDGLSGCDGDCDDADDDVHPGVVDYCSEEARDEDCDGAFDEDDPDAWYIDVDADGYGDPEGGYEGLSCEPEGYAPNAEDCDDQDLTRHPGADEVCGDGVVQDCNGTASEARDECDGAGDPSLEDDTVALKAGARIEDAGCSVAGAGDVDGDGRDDLIIGSVSDDTWVVLGSVIDDVPDKLDLDVGIVLEGAAYQAGYSVSGAGDVDGDGYDDVLVGDPAGGSGDSYVGYAWIVYGETLAGAGEVVYLVEDALLLEGVGRFQRTGRSVAGLGDIDGDSLDDLFVGTGDSDTYYVVLGASLDAGAGSLSLPDLGPTLVGTGGCSHIERGVEVSDAGDVDGDGLADLMAIDYCEASAYLVAGDAIVGESGQLDLEDLSIILDRGTAAGADAASGAGDVNGDGLDDVLYGAPWMDEGGVHAGTVYLVLAGELDGSDTHIDPLDVGLALAGDEDELIGQAVSTAGDVDGDNLADVVIGGPDASDGRDVDDDLDYTERGIVYLVYASQLEGETGTFSLRRSATRLNGFDGAELLGYAVSDAGDVDRDGLDDVLFGAPDANGAAYNTGAAFLLLTRSY